MREGEREIEWGRHINLYIVAWSIRKLRIRRVKRNRKEKQKKKTAQIIHGNQKQTITKAKQKIENIKINNKPKRSPTESPPLNVVGQHQ